MNKLQPQRPSAQPRNNTEQDLANEYYKNPNAIAAKKIWQDIVDARDIYRGVLTFPVSGVPVKDEQKIAAYRRVALQRGYHLETTNIQGTGSLVQFKLKEAPKGQN